MSVVIGDTHFIELQATYVLCEEIVHKMCIYLCPLSSPTRPCCTPIRVSVRPSAKQRSNLSTEEDVMSKKL